MTPGRGQARAVGALRPWPLAGRPARLGAAMFLKSVTELEADFDEVRAALLRGPLAWLDGLAAAAGDEGDRILVDVGLEVGGREVSRRARLEVGVPMVTDRV